MRLRPLLLRQIPFDLIVQAPFPNAVAALGKPWLLGKAVEGHRPDIGEDGGGLPGTAKRAHPEGCILQAGHGFRKPYGYGLCLPHAIGSERRIAASLQAPGDVSIGSPRGE